MMHRERGAPNTEPGRELRPPPPYRQGLAMTTGAPATTCPNCDHPGEGRYCPRCGQDNRLARLDAMQIAGEVVQNFVGWDSALGHTLKGLVRSPGGMVSEYVAGRRRRYVNPARFCLLSLAAWFLATRVLFLDPMEATGINISGSSGGETAKLVEEIRDFLARHLDILLFFALPVRAVLLRLFFRGSGRNFAECLTMVLYVAGFGFLVGVLLAPLLAMDQAWAGNVRPLLTFSWSYWAALGFFGRGWFATLWRILCVSILHAIGTFVFFGLVAVPWVLLTR